MYFNTYLLMVHAYGRGGSGQPYINACLALGAGVRLGHHRVRVGVCVGVCVGVRVCVCRCAGVRVCV
jgi:hypothetical protein